MALIPALIVFALGTSGASASSSAVVYNNIPDPQPGNLPSMAFEATSTSEFGGQIQLAGSQRVDPTVTVLMSSWGCEDGSWNVGDCSTTPGTSFSHPIKLNIYGVGVGGSVGSLIATKTQTFNIPYRPSADNINCTGGRWHNGTSCFNGLATPISFSLTGVTLPSNFIVSLAYNTTHYGYSPIGEGAACYTESGGCGYDSLNVGVTSPPSVGSNPLPNDAYLNSSWGGAYCDSGLGGTGSFRLDAGCWTGFQPAVKVEASQGCTPTGFVRDSINLTAAQIGGTVNYELDATGCNIGLYIDAAHPGGVATGADIHGANYFGVVVNGTSADVENGNIHNIGEVPFNGSQHGVGVFYTNGADGTLDGNTVNQYQKGGIVASGAGTSVDVTDNSVTGLGPVGFIAQNGIQVSFGAEATPFTGNTVTGNIYTQKAQKGVVSTGVLFFQASNSPKTSYITSNNNIFGNQANVTVIK